MMRFLAGCCLAVILPWSLQAAVDVQQSPTEWSLTNGSISIVIGRSAEGPVFKSVRRVGGADWIVPGTPVAAELYGSSAHLSDHRSGWTFAGEKISQLPNGAKQLTVEFKSEVGGVLSLHLCVFPKGATVQFSAELENRGQSTLPLLFRIDPLALSLSGAADELQPYSSVNNKHGFYPAGQVEERREFRSWLVLENHAKGESALIGGEPGVGVLDWRAS